MKLSLFPKHYKVVTTDLKEQQALDAGIKAIQQINFAGNLDRDGDKTIFFIIEEAKETFSDFLQGTVRVL